MYVMIDERSMVADAYATSFKREGIAMLGLEPNEVESWLGALNAADLGAIDAFLVGECPNWQFLPRLLRGKSGAPILCLRDGTSLEDTLSLLKAGADDVLRKPIHAREIIARVAVIYRRGRDGEADCIKIAELTVFFDGREPEVAGEVFALPRRERRILEYLARNRGRRVSKSQIFNAVYGLLDECVDEVVVESHVCKLRKKLKQRLGFDPIDSQRFLGYMLPTSDRPVEVAIKRYHEGAVFFDKGSEKHLVGCKIVELSETQAQIILTQDTLLPIDKVFLFESLRGSVCECRIEWREGNALGLRISSVVCRELHAELMLRANARPLAKDLLGAREALASTPPRAFQRDQAPVRLAVE